MMSHLQQQRNSLSLLNTCQNNTSLVVHSGLLYKQGRVMRNWKLRHVTLTPVALTYYSSEGGELKGTVDIRCCVPSSLEFLAPSRLDFGSVRHRLAIHTPARRLMLAAASVQDKNAWAFALLTLFKANQGRMEQQGPSVQISTRWSSVA
ncbi:hypothetical protein AaE_014211 [Aphanomyces astaci]|uniref:PH domain-containing protein n=1 Tax=Aphanomyces astaci TaxID=112090 RepID=A0A6A4Z175_APHAT|nr:hypothetical protein AaE_014211 [Aphanomyces astaci]